jgi:peptidyl-prolyl cis-trans isomerase SurA
MKHLVLLVTGIILLSSSIACYPALILLDQIAVIVDSDVIMQSEVKARTKAIKTQISNSPNGTLPADDVLTAQVIERLVVESLQIQMADRRGIRVSDAELNEALQSISAQNGLNLTQFRQAIEQDGISYPEMRDQIRRELKMNRLQQGIMRNRIRISEQQIKNFLDTEVGGVITADEYRVAHILLPNPADANAKQIAAVKQQADAVRKRLDEGADFQSLAVERSAGKNALEGGDLGWRKPGQLPTMFSDVAQEMEIGEVRGPIKSGSGYHLIKLIQKRGAKAEGNVEQTRVRHVLVRPSEIRTNEEARELAESLQEEVVEGRAFDEIAKLHSEHFRSQQG